jgi:hypothetical protein
MLDSTKQTPLAQDHDSFLDIVANIVGILIILVMVVSVRARQAPPETQATDPAELRTAPDQIDHAALQQDVARLITESARLEDYISIRSAERNRLSLLLAAAEHQIADDRASLKQRDRELYDLRVSVRTARENLQELEMERIRAAAIEPDREEIESLPTPIGKSVFGREVHFQLLAGRIVHVPIDALFEEARLQARQKVWKLDKLPEATETVGPKGGFHMRYTLEKLQLPLQVRMETGRTGFMIRSKLWELIPTSSRLGEPLEMALGENSAFRSALARLDPQATTVTLWTYPDSFDAFRTVKRELFELGFDAAARPLPAGVRIAGSPSGSRSTAQ